MGAQFDHALPAVQPDHAVPAVPAMQHGLNGVLEFWDVEEMALMSAGEHFMATECEWDPTGAWSCMLHV